MCVGLARPRHKHYDSVLTALIKSMLLWLSSGDEVVVLSNTPSKAFLARGCSIFGEGHSSY